MLKSYEAKKKKRRIKKQSKIGNSLILRAESYTNEARYYAKVNSIMTLRKIVTLPEPVLRRKARAVPKVDKNLQTLIDDMVETMRDAPGVGLAAPQIGLSERLIVIEYFEREEDEEKENAPKKV